MIADRSYRIRIAPADEEKVRLIIKKINDQIVSYKTNFAGKDMQDYVSMVLLWFVTEQQDGQLSPELVRISEQLSSLDNLLDQTLGGQTS